jgi:integrase
MPVLPLKHRITICDFDHLRREEVGPVLEALSPQWRPLHATAIYKGAREGELCGLRKSDVDFSKELATFARSWDRPTTKSGKARTVPLNPELVPILQEAVLSSNSDLVFPNLKGEMHSRDVDFPTVLRRALARAGIVTGYLHVCSARVNKSGRRDPAATRCGHSESVGDKAPRRCPQHGDLLWPKAQVRQIRFHDLRHNCASLLLQSGCSLAAVSRILGHADVRITLEPYGHLAPDLMQSEVAKLRRCCGRRNRGSRGLTNPGTRKRKSPGSPGLPSF